MRHRKIALGRLKIQLGVVGHHSWHRLESKTCSRSLFRLTCSGQPPKLTLCVHLSVFMSSCCVFNCLGRDVIVACRNDLPLGMIEMLYRVLNPQWLGVGIVERTPNHIKPITVCELRRLVPLVRREADWLATAAALDLDATNAGDRVTVPRLRIGWAEAAHVKSNLQVTYALAFETTACLVGNHNILSGYFTFASNFRVEVVKHGPDLLFD